MKAVRREEAVTLFVEVVAEAEGGAERYSACDEEAFLVFFDERFHISRFYLYLVEPPKSLARLHVIWII